MRVLVYTGKGGVGKTSVAAATATRLRGTLLPKPPQEAMAHFRNARREGLLGVRALVDHALERLDEEEQRARSREEGPKAIPLE